MNPRTYFVCALAALFPGVLGAAPVAADSKITSVTVYGQGAVVTRLADVALEPGTQEVVFAGLPATLDPDLIQVSGSGTAQATILDVTAAPAQLEGPANARLKELRDQARTLADEVRGLSDQGEVLKAQQDYYERIKHATVAPQGGKDQPAPVTPVAMWEQLVTFYSEGVGKVLAARQALDRKREDTQARLDAIERQIQDLEARDSRTVTNITVRVNATSAGQLSLKLAYTLPEANWHPTYDVRVASADKSLHLDYGAMVSQSTGEDWHGIALTLSTAQPNRSGTPPELTPWYVEQEQPRPMPAAAPMMMQERRKAAEYQTGNFLAADRVEADGERAAVAARIAMASVEAGLNAATFAVSYATDVPADNAAHKVAITSAPLSGEINHLAVPKLAELAYLRAAVTNTTEFPLIGGEIALFLDGNFVARSAIKTVAPGEKFALDLGVDDAISVKRKLINRLREDTGLISKRVKTTYDVVITVQNNRKTAEKLVVKDQLPVSKDERIVVTLVAPPARDITQDADGTLRWTLDLKPGEKRELPLKISVEHPADLPVSGLE